MIPGPQNNILSLDLGLFADDNCLLPKFAAYKYLL